MKLVSHTVVGKALLVCAGVIGLTSVAGATVVWDLNPNNLNAPAGSTTLSYTQQGYTITASGFDNVNGTSQPTSLYFKNVGPINGAFETGLGVANTADHELQVNSNGSPFDFIQLNLSMIIKAGATSGAVEVASVQSGESFSIFGSNVAGQLGTQLGSTHGSSFDNMFVSLPNFGQFNYYSIVASSGDVIPSEVSAVIPAVPEVNSLFPIVGLVAAIGSTHLLRRRKQARSSSGAA